MNKKQFVKLCINFNKEPSEDLFDLWKEALEDYDPYYIELALKNIITNDRYFPTLNRIIEELRNLPCIEIPENEKIKRMKAKGVVPNWLGKNITSNEGEEDEEFKTFIEEFRKCTIG